MMPQYETKKLLKRLLIKLRKDVDGEIPLLRLLSDCLPSFTHQFEDRFFIFDFFSRRDNI